MKRKLLDFIVCPKCKGKLSCEIYTEADDLPWSEIMDGSLTCGNCNEVFPISGGIPRLAIPAKLTAEVVKNVEGFGYEWLTFDKKIQGSFMTDKANFLDFIHPITEEFFQDKFVLDAGCGMGRFLKLSAEFGSRETIGVDLSQSVEAAYYNIRELPNAHVIQADIMALPFINQFDYIFSIGVLHVTENPQQSFNQLVKLLKDGGTISTWVYSKENNEWVIRYVNPLREHVTSKLPRPLLYVLCQILGIFLYVCLKLIYKPANKGFLGRQFGYWLPYNEYLNYSTQLNYASLVSVIFDQLVPRLVEYLPRDEFENWFHMQNFSEVLITSRNNMSWGGHGKLKAELESLSAFSVQPDRAGN
jgi:SAM-dependent methyltransferase/uncharacterized protein YbaR (Trm112 family)